LKTKIPHPNWTGTIEIKRTKLNRERRCSEVPSSLPGGYHLIEREVMVFALHYPLKYATPRIIPVNIKFLYKNKPNPEAWNFFTGQSSEGKNLVLITIVINGNCCIAGLLG